MTRQLRRLDPFQQTRAPDFRLGTALGWSALQLASFDGIEALSAPFRFTIIAALPGPAGRPAADALVDTGATLWIRGGRVVHGVLTSILEVDRTRAMSWYELILEPHFVRAKDRRG